MAELMIVNGYLLTPSADLRCADLCDEDLHDADLSGANLAYAVLRNSILSKANLNGANLYGANLRFANLDSANLVGANLYGADLFGAKLPENFYYPLACPSDGAFIGWKRIGSSVVKLEIPSEAKRCSATTEKCRCEYAKVLGFYNFDKEEIPIDRLTNMHYVPTEYIKGEYVYPDRFDEYRWNECSHGIHFFINFENARDYW